MRYIASFLLCCWLFQSQVFSQNRKFEHLSASDGLSDNNILAILQDKQGFIWFGTDDGLNRYDGYSFKTFKHNPADTNSLSHNVAKCLYQDKSGNIWIGTHGGGLNKFDPVTETFAHYSTKGHKGNTLTCDDITCVAEDDDFIYIATYGGGLNRINKKTGIADVFTTRSGDKSNLRSNYINYVLIDKSDNIWIATWNGGISRYEKKYDRITTFLNTPGSSTTIGANTINIIYEDSHGNIWAGTWNGGLCKLIRNLDSFITYEFQQGRYNALNSNVIKSINEAKNGSLWIGTFGGGLIEFNPLSGETINMYVNNPYDNKSISNNNIWCSFKSEPNILWIGTIEGGVNKLNIDKNDFITYKYFPNIPDGLGQNIINTFFEDKDGRIWIGTWGDGLFEFERKTGKFIQYKKSDNSPNGLVNNTINSISEDLNGNLWIGTDDGVSVFNKLNRTFINYKHNPNNQKSIGIDNVKTIFRDKKGNMWLGTWGAGLDKYQAGSNSFLHYRTSATQVRFSVDMTGINISPDGIYITGSMNGWEPAKNKLTHIGNGIYAITLEIYEGEVLYKFINGNSWGKEEKFRNIQNSNQNRALWVKGDSMIVETDVFGNWKSPQYTIIDKQQSYKSKNISSDKVWCISEDNAGNLWIGTDNGLNRFKQDKEEFIHYFHNPADLNSLSNNNVSVINIDNTNHSIWIGTLGGGISRYRADSGVFTNHETLNSSIIGNRIKGLILDKSGSLWISSNKGISKLRISNLYVDNFDVNDGLSFNNFRVGSYLLKRDGEIYFGGPNGFTAFYPQNILADTASLKVVISDIKILGNSISPLKKYDGRIILNQSVSITDNIELSYKDYVFSLEFSALQYSNQSKIKYRYILEGFDKDWIVTDNRTAAYTNLPGGTYKLRVLASYVDNFVNSKETVVYITVIPPFYKSVWFKTVLIILLLLGIYVSFRLWISAKDRKQKREMLMAERKIMHLEKQKLESELEYKSNELSSLTMHLVNRNKTLNEFKNQLELLSIKSETNTKDKLNKIAENLTNEISIEKDWAYFELHFDKVYRDFLDNLRKRHPELSKSDIQLCAYIRMGLSTKEIADLMHKTIRGVENDRYRLRKGLNLEKFDNLKDYLFTLDSNTTNIIPEE